ncbi:uncharacterized protein LAJ45_09730 [Morchella importuna]|uniref:uncharacterized protein n=1 Tax=Morchella importuna TaxID=1174673 RepID=UPI001E8ED10B|nr:uncharacterized protein LAJ45_09730 [Morchella importuna]KAH8146287.1 hypothetical protein LAJ45_09730 [Morchella importuna]
MFKLLPLLLLAVLLLSFVDFTGAVIEGNTICETTNGSPLTEKLFGITRWGRGEGFTCKQSSNGANGRPGCTLCGQLNNGSLKVSICGVKGSSYGVEQVKDALRNLMRDCTRASGARRTLKTGGKWRDKGGEFMILVHL